MTTRQFIERITPTSVGWRALGRHVVRLIAVLALISTSTGGFGPTGVAHATDGTIVLGDLTAPNIVGDSNVSASLEGPDAFMISSQYCNSNTHVVYDVTTHVGTWGGTPATSTAGEFEDTVVASGDYTGTFDLDMIPGAGNPEIRLIGELAAGECVVINSIVSYDPVDASGNPVWGKSNSNTDDLVLAFDYWATWSDPGPDLIVGTADDVTGLSVSGTDDVTVRNEITASPNKIETSTVSVNPGTVGVGETVTVTYDGVTFGSVNQGFDADGDGNPDYDVWFQAIGESNLWDPDVFQLVGVEATLNGAQCGGGRPPVTLTASDTTYFANLDAYGNCNWTGTYAYTFVALTAGSSTLAPYQEAASGSDNEKYNGDYCGDDPASSTEYCVTLTATGSSGSIDKSVAPTDANPGDTVTWSMAVTNDSTAPLGDPDSGYGVWVDDAIPAGMTYVAGTAACGTLACQIFYSTDGGAAFSAAEPATAGLVTNLRWAFDVPVPASTTDTVTFGTTADTGTSGLVDNEAAISIGGMQPPFDTATATACIGGCPDLAIDKGTTTASVAIGGQATYTINVENLASASGNATALSISDALPSGFTYASTSSIALDNSDGTDPIRTSNVDPTAGATTPTWGEWTLDPGDSVTITFVADVALAVASGTYDNTATATSTNSSVTDDGTLVDDGGFPAGVDPEDDEDVTVLAPSLTIDKDTTTPSLAPGDVATYTIAVTNTGLGTATGVTVADTFPAGWTFIASTIVESSAVRTATSNPTAGSATGTWGTWDIGASGSVTITVDVRVPTTAGGTYDNTASADATNHPAIDDDGAVAQDADTPSGSDPENDEDVTVVLAPTLTATKTDDVALADSVTAGGTIVYTVVVENTSTVNATGVVFTDTPDVDTALTVGSVTTTSGTVVLGNTAGDSSVDVSIGALAAGASATITFEVSIDVPFPIGVTDVANQGSVAADLIVAIPTDDPETTSTPDDATVTNVTAEPVLTVTKTDSPDPVEPGADITYTIGYSNTGNQTATGVELTETVPTNTTFNPTGSSGWTCLPDNSAGSTCTLTIGTLAPGASNAGTATFLATVDDTLPSTSTQISNTVSIDGDGGLNDSASTTTDVNAAPTVIATKADAPVTGGTVEPGEDILYTVVISNTGSAPATNITFTDTPGARTTLAAGTVSTGQGSVTTGNTAGDTEVIVAVGTIAAGASVTITFRATVADPYPTTAGVENQGVVTGDALSPVPTDDPALPGTADPTPTPIVITPELTVTKTDAFTAPLTPGDSITYTVDVENIGDGPATGVTFSDDLATMANLDLAGSVTTTQGTIDAGNAGGNLVTVDIGTVPAGDSVTITFVATVANPLPAGVSVVANQATVGSTNAGPDTLSDDPDTAADDDPTASPVTAAPDLVVDKDDGGVSTHWGGTVVYTITYRNAGSQDATGVVLTETVPDNATFTATGSTPGWSCAPDNTAGSSCTLAVGAVDAGATSKTAAFAVVTDNPVAAGQTQLSNTVSIADDGTNGADETPGDNAAGDTTPILTAPDLRIVKTGPTTVQPGELITFTLDYENTGQSAAISVELAESVPVGTTFDGTASDAGWSCADGDPAGTTCTLDLGTVAGGASDSVDFAVAVLEPAATTLSSIDNVATIANTDPVFPNDPTPLDNTDDATVTLIAGSIGDRIWIDADEQGDQDGSEVGAPVGTVVNLYVQGDANVFATTTTGADGAYTFGGLSSGDYTVEVEPPTGYSAFNGDTADVTLTAGDAIDDADIPINARAQIGGQVWTDADGDGIQQLTEATGPEGVTIVLLDSTGAPVPDGSGGFVTTTTGIDGVYAFPSLLAGTYQIEIDDSTLPPGFELTTPSNSGDTTVAPGDVVDDVDFGVNALGSIAGQVFVDADEDAVHDAGESDGLEGLTIALLDAAGDPVPDGSGGFVTATTDSGGNYSFGGLLAGTYRTEVVTSLPAGFAATTALNSGDVEVAVGEDVSDVDFGVNRRGSIGDLVWYDLDGNGTRNGAEPGLGGVTIHLLDATGAPIPDGLGGFVNTVTTPDGSYAFTDLLPGDYQISIDLGGQPANATLTTAGIQAITIPAATSASSDLDIDTADFGVNGDSTIGDMIYLDLNGDGVQQAGETTGIPDTTIELVRNGDVIATAVTDAGGNYSFTELLAGDYEVRVVTASVPTGGSVTSPNPLVTLGAADVELGADIGVIGNASIGDTVFLDVDADRIQSGALEVGQPDVGLVLLDAGGNEIARTVSGPTGSYLFDNVLPGSYTVEVVPETLPSSDHVVTTTDPLPVIVGDGEDVLTADIGINVLGSITGVVFFDTDADGINDAGEPGQAGVDVVLIDAAGDEVARVTVDSNGTYTFPALEIGDYTVEVDQATLPDGAEFTTPSNAQVTVVGGTVVVAADIGVATLGTVTGVVFFDNDRDGVNEFGEPGVGDVTVRLVDTDGDVVDEVVVGPDGTYVLTAIPGVYSVEVDQETLPPGTRLTTPSDARIELTPSGLPGPDFGIIGSGSIGDTVFGDENGNGIQDPDEQGLEGVTLILLDSTGAVITTVVTGPGGIYGFNDLVPGSYIVRIDAATLPPGLVLSGSGDYPVTLAPSSTDLSIDVPLVSSVTPMIPSTGADSLELARTALALLLVGAFLFAAATRRRRGDSPTAA